MLAPARGLRHERGVIRRHPFDHASSIPPHGGSRGAASLSLTPGVSRQRGSSHRRRRHPPVSWIAREGVSRHRASVITGAIDASPGAHRSRRSGCRGGETFDDSSSAPSSAERPAWTSYFPLWFEIGSLVVLTLILIADLLLILKRPHIPSTRESTLWVVFYVDARADLRGAHVGHRGPRVRRAVRRRLAHRVQPVDRQPVRLRADHEPVRGAAPLPAGSADGGHHHRAHPARRVHPASAPPSSSSSAGCSTSSAPSWCGRPGARRSPAATTTTRCRPRTSSCGRCAARSTSATTTTARSCARSWTARRCGRR